MGKARFGDSLRRIEDCRLLAGRGVFVGDISAPRQVHMAVLRSPHAHAEIVAMDITEAAAMPGVLAVVTHADLAADAIATLPTKGNVVSSDGRRQALPPYPLLARDRVRFVGQPVAAIVAQTLERALDAAEAVTVDYVPLPAVADGARALLVGAPRLHEEAPDNLCFDWETGDRSAVERAFASATTTVSLDLVNNRVAPVPIETRGAIGEYDPGSGRFTLTACHQGVHFLLNDLAHVLGIDAAMLRILTPDVGGGFGMKFVPYPEQALVLWLARRLGCPVRWIASRSEAFVSDVQARDHRSTVELALDAQGRFLALRIDTVASLGAYLTQYGTSIPTGGATLTLPGPYLLPAIHARVRGAFSNTVPVDAYRGAGQPEATYARERVIDLAAARLGIDAAELRRRNLVGRLDMPYRTATGIVIDDTDLHASHERALVASEWASFSERRKAAAKAGLMLGIGMAHYLEATGREEAGDTTRLRFEPSGRVTLFVGSVSNGQGHDTAYAQLVSSELGVSPDTVRVVSGDSDQIAAGSTGYSGSHFLQIAGPGVQIVATRARERARRIAAHLLEAAPADVEHDAEAARFLVVGTDRAVAVLDAVRAAFDPNNLPDGMDPGIDETAFFRQKGAAYPTGCHVCELAVDPATGVTRIRRYTVADDFGNVLNPLLVTGQVHGGVAQGIGQALLEGCAYDPDSGQPLTGSFQDYALPRADDLPAYVVSLCGIPNRNNPLGVKGCGEAGTIAAPAAVMGALLDALRPAGITSIDMPATAQRIWRGLRDAASSQPRGSGSASGSG